MGTIGRKEGRDVKEKDGKNWKEGKGLKERDGRNWKEGRALKEGRKEGRALQKERKKPRKKKTKGKKERRKEGKRQDALPDDISRIHIWTIYTTPDAQRIEGKTKGRK